MYRTILLDSELKTAIMKFLLKLVLSTQSFIHIKPKATDNF